MLDLERFTQMEKNSLKYDHLVTGNRASYIRYDIHLMTSRLYEARIRWTVMLLSSFNPAYAYKNVYWCLWLQLRVCILPCRNTAVDLCLQDSVL